MRPGYPWKRVAEEMEGEIADNEVRMPRFAFYLYRQSPSLTFLACAAAAFAFGRWLWRGLEGQWTLRADVVVLAVLVAGAIVLLRNMRHGFPLSVIAGGYGVGFWWIGCRIDAAWGGPMALAVGVAAMLTAAAHHEEFIQAPEPPNPMRQAVDLSAPNERDLL